MITAMTFQSYKGELVKNSGSVPYPNSIRYNPYAFSIPHLPQGRSAAMHPPLPPQTQYPSSQQWNNPYWPYLPFVNPFLHNPYSYMSNQISNAQ